MRLNEIVFSDAPPIDSYGPGFFRIAGELTEGPVIVSPFGVEPWGGYEDQNKLLEMAKDLDVLFVGTGSETAHIPLPLKSALEDAGWGVEPMATPAACRTYNILLSEGRLIAAALLPV